MFRNSTISSILLRVFSTLNRVRVLHDGSIKNSIALFVLPRLGNTRLILRRSLSTVYPELIVVVSFGWTQFHRRETWSTFG